jgi:hypothetical protein
MALQLQFSLPFPRPAPITSLSTPSLNSLADDTRSRPVLREKLVRSYGDYPYADFFIPCAAEMCVNWPYNPADCLLRVGGRESDIINPVFEEHIRNLDNWTLGSEFGKRFPELMDAVTTGIG